MSNVTVIVVLATVTMTFGAMVAVFVIRSQAPLFWGHLALPKTLWLTTAVLLASSFTLERARQRIASGDQPGFFKMTAITTALGFLFLIGQLAAWAQILYGGVVLSKNPHSWFIFLFSGLHGLHIILGLAGLVYLLARTRRLPSGRKYNMVTRAAAGGVSIFWHYLDFLWLILFALLLLWRR